MLKGLFSVDNPLMRFLSRVADVLILNLLFIITSLPVITIGASLTSLYYCLFKIKEQEEGYLLKKYFHSFKQNFKQATIMWLFMLIIGVVLFLEFLMYRDSPGTMGSVVRSVVLIGVIFWYLIGTYAFALQSRFYNTIKNTYTNAVILLFANGPRSIAILALTAAIVGFSIFQTDTWLAWNLILLWLLFGFAGIGTINVQFLYPIIKKLMPEEEKEETKSDYQFTVNEDSDLSSIGYGPASEKEGTDETSGAAEAAESQTAAPQADAEAAPQTDAAAASQTASPQTDATAASQAAAPQADPTAAPQDTV